MQLLMARRLSKGDHACFSSGDPRWWSAVCWLRIDLIEEGLMKSNSPRGIWEISEQGKALPASYRRKTNANDKTVARGSLEAMARKYRELPQRVQRKYFLQVGKTVLQW
jgi:hypothetical protein